MDDGVTASVYSVPAARKLPVMLQLEPAVAVVLQLAMEDPSETAVPLAVAENRDHDAAAPA